jgi:hypothetical protein
MKRLCTNPMRARLPWCARDRFPRRQSIRQETLQETPSLILAGSRFFQPIDYK